MLATIKEFLLAEDGGVIEWVVTIIAGSILGVLAFNAFKSSPTDVGGGVANAGKGAGNQLNVLR